METIKLPNRYGLSVKLNYIGKNLWQLVLPENAIYRIIGEPNNIYAIDPSGGPFISIGYKIDGKIVTSISSNGILTLEDESDN